VSAIPNTAHLLRPDIEQARRFLSTLDEGTERFTFQTFDDLKSRGDKSLARVLHGTIEQHFAELARLNARGAGVFVMVQAGDFRGRGAVNVVRIRDLFQENDGDGKALPLEPHLIVETSPGKDHKHLLCDGIELDEFDDILRTMIVKHGSDPDADGRNRVLRLPGFFHMKNPAAPHLVRIVHESGALPYTREQILAAFPPTPPSASNEAHGGDTGDAIEVDARTVADLRSALNFVRADDRKTWIANAYRLHELGDVGRELWLTWSMSSYSKFDAADAAKTWDGITKADRTGYAAVFAEAQAHGWVNPASGAHSREVPPDETPRTIKSTPFVYRGPRDIPPREWLYRRHYIRRFITITGGTYGVAKSTIQTVDMLSMATGRCLYTGERFKPCSVWIYNTEDPRDEVERKIVAAMMYFDIDPADIGDRLRIDTSRDQKIIVAQQFNGNSVPVMQTIDGLVDEIRGCGIDVLALDPLIHTHTVPENDNVGMGVVMDAWREVADRANCNVEIVHHIRKNGQSEATIEDIRGAAAIVGAVRSARLVTTMSLEEANRLGIGEDQRRFYAWINGSGKPSLQPPVNRRDWIRLVSVNLGNATPDYPEGDSVGVATPWTPPNHAGLNWVSVDECRRCWYAIRAADPLEALRASEKSSAWIGHLLVKVLGLDTDDPQTAPKVKALISEWLRVGLLERVNAKDRKGTERPCYALDWGKTGEDQP